MLRLHLPSLQDLCCIRLAYLMWIRHDVIKACRSMEEWNNLGDTVLAHVETFSLPEKLKPLILKPLKPVGQHLHIFLRLWLSKTQPENSVNWLTQDMLSECLILNADGLMNNRKMAEKILSSRMIPNVFAFRLACVNFLEVEVLKLWPHVMQYFLNKMMLESENPHVIDKFSVSEIYRAERERESNGVFPFDTFSDIDHKPASVSYAREPPEVLFWISHCISIEQLLNILAVPFFESYRNLDNMSLRTEFFNARDWQDFNFKAAVSSGNVAFFDYFNKYRNKYFNIHRNKKKYCYKEMTKNILLRHQDILHTSFVYHYRLLTSSEIEYLFRYAPTQMVFQFLQWPLSLTFINEIETIWNLIPDEKKNWLFSQLLTILFENNNIVYSMTFPSNDFRPFTVYYSLLHDMDHMASIFVNVWNICSDSLKTEFLNTYVFESVLGCFVGQHDQKLLFQHHLQRNGLKEKLLHLFLANGETILELYAGQTIKATLRGLVANHVPEYFEALDRGFIGFLNATKFQFRRCHSIQEMYEESIKIKRSRSTEMGRPYHTWYLINESFVNRIKSILFLSNNISNSFIYG